MTMFDLVLIAIGVMGIVAGGFIWLYDSGENP